MRRTVASRRQLAAFVEERCRLLGLRCDCPHVVRNADESELEFAAFLPQFGGPRGLLLDVVTEPDFVPSKSHNAAASGLGIPVSFINPSSLLEDANEFVAVLRDWGYFGRCEDLTDHAKALLLAPRD
jgi:hypothetical protein